MKMKVFTIFCVLLLSIGCSKKDDTVDPVVPEQKDPPKEEPALVILTGKFVDGDVQGLSFSTATQSGTTSENGEFTYVAGEEITFKIGDVVLGKALGQDQITPITLAQESDANATIESKTAQNIAAFLQTLDTDGDETNGITISQEAASNLGVTGIDFSGPVESGLADIVLSVVQNAGIELKLVYPSDAANNMAKSLGLEYEAPENLSLTHLIPVLKTYFQTWDKGFTPPNAVYRNTFDVQGNLMSIDILSRYSSKIFYSLGFNSYNEKGMPQSGTLTTFRANSLYGSFPTFVTYTDEISLAYNQDDQLSSLSFINDAGINVQTEQFIAFDEVNRPLSYFRDLGSDDPNRDFTITWNFSYENGFIATADRIYDEVWVVDQNNTYVTYTTRDFKYKYNEINNLIGLDYTRVFSDNSIINGENQSSRTEATVSESFTYGNGQKLISYVVNEDVIPSLGDPYTATITRNYDSNELIEYYNYTSSNGFETIQSYEQGITYGSENYSNGLLSSEQEYSADGSSTFSSIFYDENDLISFKDVSEYSLEGLVQRIFEYYFNGNLDFTIIEEYDANFLTKSTGYNADGSIQYVDYLDQAGFRTRVDVYFEGELSYYEEFEYDANGFTIRALSIWPDGEVYGIREFVYNELGLVEVITYSDPDGGIYLTDVYEYDVNSYLSKITGYGANNNISYILFYEEGVLVREEIYDENGVLVDVFDYTTTGKRVIVFKKEKDGRFNNQNHQQSLTSNLHSDSFRAVPSKKLSNKNLKIAKSYDSMLEQRSSDKIRSIRMGKPN